jgi:hypothetical protein
MEASMGYIVGPCFKKKKKTLKTKQITQTNKQTKKKRFQIKNQVYFNVKENKP